MLFSFSSSHSLSFYFSHSVRRSPSHIYYFIIFWFLLSYLTVNNLASATPMWESCTNVLTNFTIPSEGGTYEAFYCNYTSSIIIEVKMELFATESYITLFSGVFTGIGSGFGLQGPNAGAALAMPALHISLQHMTFLTDSAIKFLGALPPKSTLMIQNNSFFLTKVNDFMNVGSNLVAIVVSAPEETISLTNGATIAIKQNALKLSNTHLISAVVYIRSTTIRVSGGSLFSVDENVAENSVNIAEAYVVHWGSDSFMLLTVSDGSQLTMDSNVFRHVTCSTRLFTVVWDALSNSKAFQSIQVSNGSTVSVSSNGVKNSTSADAIYAWFWTTSLATVKVTNASLLISSYNWLENVTTKEIITVHIALGNQPNVINVTDSSKLIFSGNWLADTVVLTSAIVVFWRISSGSITFSITNSSEAAMDANTVSRFVPTGSTSFARAVIIAITTNSGVSNVTIIASNNSRMSLSYNRMTDIVAFFISVAYLTSDNFVVISLLDNSSLSLDHNFASNIKAVTSASGAVRVTYIAANVGGLVVSARDSSEFTIEGNSATNVQVDTLAAAVLWNLPGQIILCAANFGGFRVCGNSVVNATATITTTSVIRVVHIFTSKALTMIVSTNSILSFNNNKLSTSASRNLYAVYLSATTDATLQTQDDSLWSLNNNSVRSPRAEGVALGDTVPSSSVYVSAVGLNIDTTNRSTFMASENHVNLLYSERLITSVTLTSTTLTITATSKSVFSISSNLLSNANVTRSLYCILLSTSGKTFIFASEGALIAFSQNSVCNITASGSLIVSVGWQTSSALQVLTTGSATLNVSSNGIHAASLVAPSTSKIASVLIDASSGATLGICAMKSSSVYLANNSVLASQVTAGDLVAVNIQSDSGALNLTIVDSSTFSASDNSVLNGNVNGHVSVISILAKSSLLITAVNRDSTLQLLRNSISNTDSVGSASAISLVGTISTNFSVNRNSVLSISQNSVSRVNASGIGYVIHLASNNNMAMKSSDSSRFAMDENSMRNSDFLVEAFGIHWHGSVTNMTVVLEINSTLSVSKNSLLRQSATNPANDTVTWSLFRLGATVASQSLITIGDYSQVLLSDNLMDTFGGGSMPQYFIHLLSSIYLTGTTPSFSVVNNTINAATERTLAIIQFKQTVTVHVAVVNAILSVSKNHFVVMNSSMLSCPPAPITFQNIVGEGETNDLSFIIDRNTVSYANDQLNVLACQWLSIDKVSNVKSVSISNNEIRNFTASTWVASLAVPPDGNLKISANVIESTTINVTHLLRSNHLLFGRSAQLLLEQNVFFMHNNETSGSTPLSTIDLGSVLSLYYANQTGAYNAPFGPQIRACNNIALGRVIHQPRTYFGAGLEAFLSDCNKTASISIEATGSSSVSLSASASQTLSLSSSQNSASIEESPSTSLTSSRSDIYSASLSASASSSESASYTVSESIANCTSVEVCPDIVMFGNVSSNRYRNVCNETEQANAEFNINTFSDSNTMSIVLQRNNLTVAQVKGNFPWPSSPTLTYGTMIVESKGRNVTVSVFGTNNITTVFGSTYVRDSVGRNLTIVDFGISVLTVGDESKSATKPIGQLKFVFSTYCIGGAPNRSATFSRTVSVERAIVFLPKAAESKNTVTVATGTTSGIISATAGAVATPIGAMQQGVALALVRMAQCDEDPLNGEELDFLMHPLHFPIGTGDAAYARGAVIGNLFIIPAIWSIISFFAVPYVIRSLTLESIPSSRDFVGWPGLAVTPFAVLSEGSAMTSVGLLTRASQSVGDAILGTVGLAMLITVLVCWVRTLWILTRLPKFQSLICEKVHTDVFKQPLVARYEWAIVGLNGAPTPQASLALFESAGLLTPNLTIEHTTSRSLMTPTQNAFIRRRLVLIGDSWWLWSAVLTNALSLLVGVAEGFPVGDNAALCKARWGVAGLAAISQAAIVLTSTVPIEMLLMGVTGVLSCVLVVLISIITFIGESNMTADALDITSIISSLLGIALMVVGIAGSILELLAERKRVTTQRSLEFAPALGPTSLDVPMLKKEIIAEDLDLDFDEPTAQNVTAPTSPLNFMNTEDFFGSSTFVEYEKKVSSFPANGVNKSGTDSPDEAAEEEHSTRLRLPPYRPPPMPAAWLEILDECQSMADLAVERNKNLNVSSFASSKGLH